MLIVFENPYALFKRRPTHVLTFGVCSSYQDVTCRPHASILKAALNAPAILVTAQQALNQRQQRRCKKCRLWELYQCYLEAMELIAHV